MQPENIKIGDLIFLNKFLYIVVSINCYNLAKTEYIFTMINVYHNIVSYYNDQQCKYFEKVS